LQPVTQALQAVQLDMLGVKQHADKLLWMFSDHWQNAEKIFAEDIYAAALKTAEEIGVTISVPRQCGRQIFFNPVSQNPLLRDEHAGIYVIPAASSPVGES